MVEVITKIKTAEENAEELKRTARRIAAQLREEAVTNGRRLLENEAQRAAGEAALILEDAEKRAGEYLDESHSKSRMICDDLKASAQGKLDAAAQFIVERIVDSL